MLHDSDILLALLLFSSIVVLASCCGLCGLLIRWRGKSAGIALGSIVLACGVVVFVLTWITKERYWWISLPPMLLGIQTIRVWRLDKPLRGFRLSTLLIVIGFVGAMFAGMSQIYRQRLSERPIVSKLESLINGQVDYDFDGLAIGVTLKNDEDSLDESLALLVQLPHIRRFQVTGYRISLNQAKQIGELANLQHLYLQSTDFDDDKIEQLARLKKLETLDLMNTQVTGNGLKHLRDAKRLRRIWLSDETMSPEDVEQLRAMFPRLEVSY